TPRCNLFSRGDACVAASCRGDACRGFLSKDTFMATRTGNFSLGFRRAGVEWQKDLPRLAKWSKQAGFDVIDLTHRASGEDYKTLKDAGLAVGSVDLLDFGQIMAGDAAKRKDVLEANLKFVKESAAAGGRAFFACIIPGDPAKKR